MKTFETEWLNCLVEKTDLKDQLLCYIDEVLRSDTTHDTELRLIVSTNNHKLTTMVTNLNTTKLECLVDIILKTPDWFNYSHLNSPISVQQSDGITIFGIDLYWSTSCQPLSTIIDRVNYIHKTMAGNNLVIDKYLAVAIMGLIITDSADENIDLASKYGYIDGLPYDQLPAKYSIPVLMDKIKLLKAVIKVKDEVIQQLEDTKLKHEDTINFVRDMLK